MQCPGQDSRYWDGEAIFEYKCPKCGNTLEFFKDDSKRRCKKCGNEVFNPHMDFGCASYCPYAEQCLGSLPPELLAKKQEQLISKTAAEIKKLLGENFKAIGHAGRLARHAEALAETMEGGNKAVVVLAAYLQALTAVDSSKTAAAVARPILKKLGANQGLSDEVCEVLDHHGPISPEDRSNVRILLEAQRLAVLEENNKKAEK